MSNTIEVVISSKDQTSAGFKSADKGAREMGKGFDKAGEAADGAEGKAQGFASTLTGTKDTMAGIGEIAKGNLFEGFVMAGQGVADLAEGFAYTVIPLARLVAGTVAHKAATIASAAATKAMTAAQWLLNAALTANPIGLVVAAIALLVVALVIAYKKSETFRNIMNEAFAAVGVAVLSMASTGMKATKFLLEAFLNMVGGILNAVAKIPGPTQSAAKKAAEGFNDFKKSTISSLDGAIKKVDQWGVSLRNMPKVARLQGDIKDLDSKLATARKQLADPKLTATKRAQLQANIAQLLAAKATAQRSINSLTGKTVNITTNVYRNMIETTIRKDVGVRAPGHAAGGYDTDDFIAGENGPELVEMDGGQARISPAANTQNRLRQSSAASVVLKIESGGSRLDDLLVELLRKAIRVQGGDVQVVLGS